MSIGRPALTDLPRIQIVKAAGQTFSIRALKAALNEVAQMQINNTVAGVYNNVRCGSDEPYSTILWNITKTAGSTSATGTVTAASVQAADTVTVNGLVYTAVSGVKSNSTEFSIDGTDDDVASDLAASITADDRVGTLGDLSAISAAAVVTITSSLEGTAGDAVTLSSSDGGRLAVSGATFSGGVDSADYTLVFVSEDDTTVVSSLGRPALSERRLLDIAFAFSAFDFTVRSSQAVLNYIEKFEDKVASLNDSAALDGTYNNQRVLGPTPYETYIWDVVKLGNVYTLTPTVNS